MSVEEASQVFVRAASRSTTLYEFADEYLALVNLLEDPDADFASISAELEKLAGQIAQKADNIARFIRECEGLAEMRRAEAKRLQDGAYSFERKADMLRSYVLRQMQLMNVPRIDTDRFTFAVRQNPPSVKVLEPMLVPSEFQRTKVTIDVDKRAITDHYKTTGEVPAGVEIARGERLEIR